MPPKTLLWNYLYLRKVGCIFFFLLLKYGFQNEKNKNKKKLKCNFISQPNNILTPERVQVILEPLNVYTFAGKEAYRMNLESLQ